MNLSGSIQLTGLRLTRHLVKVEAAVVMITSLNETARLELLSLFAIASDPSTRIGGEWVGIWEAKLGQNPLTAIKTLIRNGELVLPSRVEALLGLHSAVELRALAKERHLLVSGRKDILARRIADADPQLATNLMRVHQLVVCSAEARSEVERYKANKKARLAEAQKQTLDLLKEKRFTEASQIMTRFEASMFFPRGLNIDWTLVDLSDSLGDLFTVTPGFHKARWGGVQEHVRLLAAMSCLWGEKDFRQLLPLIVPEGKVSEAQIMSARMLNFYIDKRASLKQARDLMPISAEVLSTHDARTCAICRADDGKIYAIDEAPELPHVNCLCDDDTGCRCVYTFPIDLSKLL